MLMIVSSRRGDALDCVFTYHARNGSTGADVGIRFNGKLPSAKLRKCCRSYPLQHIIETDRPTCMPSFDPEHMIRYGWRMRSRCFRCLLVDIFVAVRCCAVHNNKLGKSNLAIGGIAANWGFRPLNQGRLSLSIIGDKCAKDSFFFWGGGSY